LTLKLGSLFSGSGGFELAGALHGIEPVWASEIEKYPVAVTTARFPNMKHLGSILEINGAEIEPVDIITGGSPCQDLSVAGGRDGLVDGGRSNLFFEMIRVIKEMRIATNGLYPRIVLWENVPGAFSSNKGKDFQRVIEEFCNVADDTVSIPEPPKGKWLNAGQVVGDGYSIAWRTFDAQYWGVPQRRKRIYLIADFASECASEIFSEQEGVRWDREKAYKKGQQFIANPFNAPAIEERYASGDATWWNGRDVSQCLDRVLYKKQALPEKDRFPAVLVPAWEKCAMCDDFICNLHGCHVYECDCPDTDDWCANDLWPYDPMVLRYITPLECCRLQGLPDWWLDGVDGSDSAKYKMLGNGIAMPNTIYVVGCAVRLLQEGKHENEG